ncbi:MAG: hypothetical protein ABIM89_03025 [Mycobacteriales bacterium]
MRVYFPSTFAGLRDLRAGGEIGPAPLHGHAVTPALRESYAVGDTDELEHVAQLAASSDSLSLLHEDRDVPRQRVVIAAEVPDESIKHADDGDESSVTVTAVVSLSAVDAFLVDDPDCADIIDAAADAWSAAQTGDDDALFMLDEAGAHDLMWFARQELDQLLG